MDTRDQIKETLKGFVPNENLVEAMRLIDQYSHERYDKGYEDGYDACFSEYSC